MKIKLFALGSIVLAGISSHAQLKGFSIGPYGEMIWPVGNAQQKYTTGIGGGINADIRVRKFGVTASAGFIHLAGRQLTERKEQQLWQP
jgi:hypothetical protein